MTTFLGLGEMGRALATVGGAATVWNRTPKAFPGAAVAATVEEAVAGTGLIVACLFDLTSVHDVLDPVVDGLDGRTLLNLTTTTPRESRDLAAWAAGHGVTYLDGAIMAVPEMIGGPGSAVLYSGDAAAFEAHRPLLDRWGTATFLGTDAGAAALYDMAMLTGMYTMFAGFLHGAAMVAADGGSVTGFAAMQAPFLAAMTNGLAGFASTVDTRDYGGPGQQSLAFTDTALAALLAASAEQGVDPRVLTPVRELVRRQIDAGFGAQGTARIFEELSGGNR
ncbi:imine reductase family protein [Virgisporangium ochraceum]|uniref:Oxidoreductase n=1 Tax=Virgisporangium ochraceum TaxID=65505 RepID=A0A8J4EAQ1_9ACTN|nr:NAD(P)-binding domain-containing protein [Virgisporangium ochraceum]GIJ68545.1 oxidoreductase [Virgisporangium ochraceum]